QVNQHVVETLDVNTDLGAVPLLTFPAWTLDRGRHLRRVVTRTQTAGDALRDRLRRHVMLTDRREQRIEIDVAHLDDPVLELRRLPHLPQRQSLPPEFGGEIVPAEFDHVDATFSAEPLTDLVARPRRHDEGQPVLRRTGRLGPAGEDLDVVAARG